MYRKPRQIDPTSIKVEPFDPSNIIIIDHAIRSAPPLYMSSWGGAFSGDIAEIQQNLYASVKVGRMDRAVMLARRINHMLGSTAPETHDAYHRYFCGMLDTIMLAPTREKLTDMQKALELDVRARGVPFDSRIVSIIIKAVFQILSTTQLDRTLRRYLKYAKDLGSAVEENVLASELFTESEWCRLVRLQPQHYSASQEFISLEPLGVHDAEPATRINRTLDLTEESYRPDIKSTESKSSNLSALKQSLKSLVPDAKQQLDNFEDHTDARRIRQETLEADVLGAALDKWRSEAEQFNNGQQKLNKPSLGLHIHNWIQDSTALLQQELEKADSLDFSNVRPEHRYLAHIAPLLRLSTPEKLCAVSLIRLLNLVLEPSLRRRGYHEYVSLSIAAGRIGGAIANEIKVEKLGNSVAMGLSNKYSEVRRQRLARILKRTSYKCPLYGDGTTNNLNSLPLNSIPPSTLEITASIKFQLGAFFLSLILPTAKMPLLQPGQDHPQNMSIAEHKTVWEHGRLRGIIQYNSHFLEHLKREPPPHVIAKHLPMLTPPKPWSGLSNGCYLKTPCDAVRSNDSSKAQQEYLKIAEKRGHLNQIFRGLDVISGVPWRINRELFQVISEVWNSGEGIAKFAPEKPDVQLPEKPSGGGEADRAKMRRWRSITKDLQNQLDSWHSQRCYQNFQFEIARNFLDDEFYTPHNIDFRGRAYPIPPYFNHMGADYVRALFLFAKGKPLGERGLSWLKIHLANTYGFDKECLEDRRAFTDDKIAEIYDSADNPLRGRRWWLTSEHPWQTLAACIELRNALNSPVPSEYVSHLPIQQDGSCNGLQHYAALGGDTAGAEQVNLAPSDRPADIYSGIADKVKVAVAEDLRKGDPKAKMLNGKITRKVVKQPVMTNVYGVTFHGAAHQVRKQLAEILPPQGLDDEVGLMSLSSYVAKLIFQALGEMFRGAHAIQDWLIECGGRISSAITPEQMERLLRKRKPADNDDETGKANFQQLRKDAKRQDASDSQFRSTVVWTTPLGLPVVQPYRDNGAQMVKTVLQALKVIAPSVSDPVSKRQQLQGFPPNFIHSLDATHMMLSALKCDEIGLTFAAVHDSFWTHACDVPVLNDLLRGAMIRMHSEDIIGRLREEFVARYKDCLQWVAIDGQGALGQKIEQYYKRKPGPISPFRQNRVKDESQTNELLWEYQRQKLLGSDDAADQEEGQNMESAYSIYEEFLRQHPDVSPTSLYGGAITSRSLQHEGSEQAGLETQSIEEGVADTEMEEIASEEEPEEVTAAEPCAETEDSKDSRDEERAELKKPTSGQRRIYLWMPLTFPEPPRRGGFDVTQLEKSVYFFS